MPNFKFLRFFETILVFICNSQVIYNHQKPLNLPISASLEWQTYSNTCFIIGCFSYSFNLPTVFFNKAKYSSKIIFDIRNFGYFVFVLRNMDFYADNSEFIENFLIQRD